MAFAPLHWVHSTIVSPLLIGRGRTSERHGNVKESMVAFTQWGLYLNIPYIACALREYQIQSGMSTIIAPPRVSPYVLHEGFIVQQVQYRRAQGLRRGTFFTPVCLWGVEIPRISSFPLCRAAVRSVSSSASSSLAMDDRLL
ncbi:unnamed protein product [Echinostoma caproni]|uniref:Uncharacterized protein n=1 Tax=Echinostoma caproni TaxID=27848 RepID=A0A183AEW6_9TREM|nr:unnamed protein product [Echinostoma caproni]